MGDPTQTREGAGATATTTESGATTEATAGANMRMMEARRGQTLTPEVTMAEVTTVEVAGTEASLVSRLHLPRTRGGAHRGRHHWGPGGHPRHHRRCYLLQKKIQSCALK